jgi:hypothetical protein
MTFLIYNAKLTSSCVGQLGGDFVLKVSWDKAESDLDSVDPAVVVQLKENAEEILHDIPPRVYLADEGFHDGIMWHRGEAHTRLEDQADGPQNYFLFYAKSDSDREFEILAVRSVHQVSSKWLGMTMASYFPFY